jgi:hypothetical protein
MFFRFLTLNIIMTFVFGFCSQKGLTYIVYGDYLKENWYHTLLKENHGFRYIYSLLAKSHFRYVF